MDVFYCAVCHLLIVNIMGSAPEPCIFPLVTVLVTKQIINSKSAWQNNEEFQAKIPVWVKMKLGETEVWQINLIPNFQPL